MIRTVALALKYSITYIYIYIYVEAMCVYMYACLYICVCTHAGMMPTFDPTVTMDNNYVQDEQQNTNVAIKY